MKRIAIVGYPLGPNSIGATVAYLQYFQQFGDVKILMPNTTNEEIDTDIDLLVLPGGADVDTKRYDQAPSLYTGKPNHMLEWFDTFMLPKYIEAGIPILGICRGMQSLNVHFGGSLHQDISWTGHDSSEKSRSELVNSLDFTDKYKEWKEKIVGRKAHKVNSIHHQSADSLGEGLELVAYCREHLGAGENFDVVEIVRHTELPIWGFQYHPEEIWDELSNAIISDLVSGRQIYGGKVETTSVEESM